jgi:hypothetical protein
MKKNISKVLIKEDWDILMDILTADIHDNNEDKGDVCELQFRSFGRKLNLRGGRADAVLIEIRPLDTRASTGLTPNAVFLRTSGTDHAGW